MKRAVNPETGEVVFLVNNQWVSPTQTAVNEAGEKAYLLNNEWIVPPVPAAPTLSPEEQMMAPIGADTTGGVELSDYGKLFGAGAVKSTLGAPEAIQAGTSGMARDTATKPTEFLDYIADPRKLANDLAQSVRLPKIFEDDAKVGIMPEKTMQKQKLAIDEALTKGKIQSFRDLTNYGSKIANRIEDSVTDEMKLALADSQPTGNIIEALETGDFSKISLGKDPSLAGVLGQASKVFGSTAPAILTSVVSKSPMVGGIAGFGQAGSEGVEAAREHIKSMNNDQLAEKSEYFRNLLALGYNPELARKMTEEKAADTAAYYQGMVGALGNQFTSNLIKGNLDDALLANVRSRLGRIVKGGAVGMTEEGLQELAEGIATDLGIDRTVVREMGVDSFANVVLGAIGGGAPGAGRGAISRGPEEEVPPAPPVVTPPATPTSETAPPTVTDVTVPPEVIPAAAPVPPAAPKSGAIAVDELETAETPAEVKPSEVMMPVVDADGNVTDELDKVDLNNVFVEDGQVWVRGEEWDHDLMSVLEELKDEDLKMALVKRAEELMPKAPEAAIETPEVAEAPEVPEVEDDTVRLIQLQKRFSQAEESGALPTAQANQVYKLIEKEQIDKANALLDKFLKAAEERKAKEAPKATEVLDEEEVKALPTAEDVDVDKNIDRIRELGERRNNDEELTDEEDALLDAAHRKIYTTAESIKSPPPKKGYASRNHIDVNQVGGKWVAGSSYMGKTGGYGLAVSYDSEPFDSREEAINAEIDKMRPYAMSQDDKATLKWLDSIDSRVKPAKAQTKEEKAEANRKRQEEKKAATKKEQEEETDRVIKAMQEEQAKKLEAYAGQNARTKELEGMLTVSKETPEPYQKKDLEDLQEALDEASDEYRVAARKYINTGEGRDEVVKATDKVNKATEAYNKAVLEGIEEEDSGKAYEQQASDDYNKVVDESYDGKKNDTDVLANQSLDRYIPFDKLVEIVSNAENVLLAPEQLKMRFGVQKAADAQRVIEAVRKKKAKPAADFDSYVDSVSDQIDRLVDYARVARRSAVTRDEVINKLRVAYKESPEKAQSALDGTEANMKETARRIAIDDLSPDYYEAVGKTTKKEDDLVRAIKSGILDISGQENADAIYTLFDINKSDIKTAEKGEGVPALLSKFAGSFFGKPKEVSEQVYDEAAKQFLEGDLKAKVPTGKMDTINPVRLKDVTPKPIEKSIKPIANTFADQVKALFQIAPKQEIRYYLTGIHVQDAKKRLVTTDGHRLAVINNASLKDAPKKTGDATIYTRDNKYIDGQFPDIDRVIPKEHAENKTTFDVKPLGDHARGANKAWRYVTSKTPAPIQINLGDTKLSFNAKYIEDMSNIFRQMGYDTAEISMKDGKIYATSPDGKVQQVIMSMRDDNPLFAEYTLGEPKAKPAERAKTMTEEEVFGGEEVEKQPKKTKAEINKERQEAKKAAATKEDKGPFYGNFTGNLSEDEKMAMRREAREEKIIQKGVTTRKITTVTKKIAKVGSDIETQKALNYLLAKQADLSNEILATKEERRSADWFRATASTELAKGNLMPETMAVIDELYRKYPSFLEGLKLSVRAGKRAGVEGAFDPFERLVKIYKNPFSVTQDETMRHEIMHSLEQMMTPEAQIAVVKAWSFALSKAINKHKDERSQDFFNAVLDYVENPTRANFRKATNKMPYPSFYQYMNPSEFWAVNGEKLMKAQLGNAWARFVKGVQKILEALKNVFGFDNRYAVHREFDRLMKGESGQMTDKMLADYLKQNDEEIEFLNQVSDVDELLEKHERPDAPLHPSDSLKDRLLHKTEKITELYDQYKRNPRLETSKMIGDVDRAITYARNKNVWFGTGLELADLKRYNGQLRDDKGFAVASIALTNAVHAGHVATQVVTHGGLRFDPVTQQFTAYDSKYSLANIVREKANLIKKLGEQRATNLIQAYFEAKRSLSIKDEFSKRQNALDKLRQQFESAVETEEKDQLYKDMVEAEEDLRRVSVALDKVNMTDEAISDFIAMEKEYPELKAMMRNWTAVNQNMINNLEFSGIISKKRAEVLRNIKDYVPWYRIQEDMADPHDPVSKGVRGLTNVVQEKKFKKGETELEIDDIVDNMIHNVMMTTRNSIRNYAANRIAQQYATRNDKGKIKVFPKEGTMSDGAIRVNILANGRRIVIEIKDPLIAEAVLGMESIEIPMLNALGVMANGLRRGITSFPIFQLKQLFMDAPTAAWVSGVKNPFKLWADTFASFVAALNPNDPIVKMMKAYGIGGYQSSARTPEKELKMQIGLIGKSPLAYILKTLDHIGDASDYAQRRAVYKQVLQETGDEMQALLQANNVIDFLKHGSGRAAQATVKTVAFMNAYAQSMDVMAQAMAGGGLKGKQRKEVFAQFVKTGMILTTLSLLYAFAIGDDDEYQQMDDQTKARNFIIPKSMTKFIGMDKSIKIPMHTSASFFFKSVPELIYNKIMNEGTKNHVDNQRLRTALREAATDALLGPNVTPTGVKPFLEIGLNKNFFTGGTLTPKGMENLEAFRQYTANTSELGKVISKGTFGLLNPIEADHLMRSLLGTAGAAAMWGSNLFSGDRPEPNASANPLYGEFVSAPVPRGREDIYYDLKERSTKVHDTFIDMMKKGRTEEANKYRKENEALFKAYGYTNGVEQGLKQLNAEIRRIGDLPGDKLTPAQKRERITYYQEKKTQILKDVIEYRKRAGL